MHAPLRRFFERLSNSSNKEELHYPTFIRREAMIIKEEKIVVKDGRLGGTRRTDRPTIPQESEGNAEKRKSKSQKQA